MLNAAAWDLRLQKLFIHCMRVINKDPILLIECGSNDRDATVFGK